MQLNPEKYWPTWRVTDGPLDSIWIEVRIMLGGAPYIARQSVPRLYLKHIQHSPSSDGFIARRIAGLDNHMRAVWNICRATGHGHCARP